MDASFSQVNYFTLFRWAEARKVNIINQSIKEHIHIGKEFSEISGFHSRR
jgi:hypothetical protein